MATQTTLPKKVLKIYLPALVKVYHLNFLQMNMEEFVWEFQNTGEADAGVRDSAFECLGMLWKCLGEKHILPNITDLDELKLNKVRRKFKNFI